MTNFLPVSYADREALEPEMYLTDEEVAQTIEREQAEADAWAAKRDAERS